MSSPNTNPTFLRDGVPVLIYLSQEEFEHINTLSKELFKTFRAQNQKFLKTDDIREFCKFSVLAYYNMVILKVREEAALQKKSKQQQQFGN